MSDPRIICTVGMHRSGTSAITRGLLALGVPLGDRLMPATPGNAKGYFEDLDVVALNESILRRIGSDWYSTGKIDETMLTSRALAPERRAAVQLLDAKLAGRPLFGIKDPRLAVLLPFWRGVFEELGLEDCYVIPVRSPLEVMKSLHKREGVLQARGMALWVKYMLGALSHTCDRTRVFVSYERMLDSPLAELNRLAELLGLEALAPTSPEFVEYSQTFLDSSMRHEKSSARQLRASIEIPEPVRPFYDALNLASENSCIPASAQSRIRAANRWFESLSTLLLHLDELQKLLDETIAARDAQARAQSAAYAEEMQVLRLEFQQELQSRAEALGLERATSIALAEKVDSIAAGYEQERQLNEEHLRRLEVSLAGRERQIEELAATLESERLSNLRALKNAMESSVENTAHVKQLEVENACLTRRLELVQSDSDRAAHESAALLSDLQAKHIKAESALADERIRHDAVEATLRERLRGADAISATYRVRVDALEAEVSALVATKAALELQIEDQLCSVASAREQSHVATAQIASLQYALTVQSQIVADLQKKADLASADVVAMRTSNSWRITAPFRQLKSFFWSN